MSTGPCEAAPIARDWETAENKNKNKKTSNMVVIIYCYIGYEDEVTTLKREQRGPMM